MKNFEGGGLGSPKILYVGFLRVFFLHLNLELLLGAVIGVCPPCAAKTCAVRPVFARWRGSCGWQIQANVPGPMKQNASPREQFEAPTRRWKPGPEQHPGPETRTVSTC